MKLRKLTLQGYKTFATRTEFVFDSSITAIVGPNGSGKSNVADALRWVLGEQSYSTLRAKRSADMIFVGSQQRARAGMAQATITLDNTEGWLPIDFAEVEIARRAFRSGENEYLINGQQVRLKDLTDILATSGLAERTYTIIGQGLVDQALSLRSDERRALFEEAAGITHYKIRRAETLRRLEETQHNLQRVHDILDELRPRVASLKRQATRTRNFEQVSADLRQHLRVWYGYKWEQTKGELRAARAAAEVAEADWSAARTRLLSLQDSMAATQQRLARAQQQLAERQATREQLREQLERHRRQQAVWRERRASLERQIAETEYESVLLTQQQTAAQRELSTALVELEAAQNEKASQETRLHEYRTAFQATEAEIKQRQNEVTGLQSEHHQTQTARAQTEGELVQLRERLSELQAQAQSEAPSRAEPSELRQREADIERLREQRQQVSRDLATAKETRSEEIGQLNRMRGQARDEELALARLRNDLARFEERMQLLEKQRQGDLPLNSEHVVGRLATLIDLPPAHATALKAALGARFAAWIVRETDDIWEAVSIARQNNQATHLLVAATSDHFGSPPHSITSPDVLGEHGVIGWAVDFVEPDGPASAVVHGALGAVLLVTDLATAFRLSSRLSPGSAAVTPDGVVVQSGGLVEVVPPDLGDDLLAAEARRHEASARLAELRETIARREKQAGDLQAVIDALQSRVDEHSDNETRLSRLEFETGQQLTVMEQALLQSVKTRETLARQVAERAMAGEQLQTRITRAERAVVEQNERLAHLERRLEDAQRHLAALPVNESAQQQHNLSQALSASLTILAGRQAVVDSRRATLNQIDGQLGRLHERLMSLKEQYGNLATTDDDITVTALEAQLGEQEVALLPLQVESDADRATLEQLQSESTALQRHTLELETQLTQARIRLAQHQNQIEGLQERIRADLGLVALRYDAEQTGATPLPMHEVVEQLPVVSELPPDIEESIHSYRGQLHRMGAINPDAPAELALTEERLEFLSGQVEDLTRTDEQLRRIISELDELTSRAFAQTVEQVNVLFDQTFRKLFGGGSGRLAMTDPDDPTSSGVEIVARLPNRREQGLALLSGGERSLTAAALIFSLLRVAPPPFCVLDEVDAALDEANVTRFRELLQELARQTQFILITHNRGTVQAAQTLYGVSMQPDSASQVISLKPEEFLRR